jgi:hypothetical protein
MKGWHFIRRTRKLAHGDGRRVKPGEVYSVPPPIALCDRGLHASERVLDALRYAPASNKLIACRVWLAGKIIRGNDKAVATRRRVEWMVSADRILHEFAVWCGWAAQLAIPQPDPRCIAALRAKEAWLRGDIDDKELDAARDAARDAQGAAWAAARDAAQAAAWAAAWAAQSGVWIAAQGAAWAATRDAQGAAWGAAQGAAWAATRVAAANAAWDAAEAELVRRFEAAPRLT